MGKRKQYTRKAWTDEEIEHLIELRSKYTKKDIARLLKRSPSSVNGKIQDLELGGLMDNTDRWTFTQISEAVGVSKCVVNKTWVKYGLKFVKRGYFCLVEESELLRFMKTHPELWNAAKCDYYLFYQYSWFLKKLEQDKKVPVEHRCYYWTDYQKQQFDFLIRKGYTHRQIAEKIGKTKSAVDHYSSRLARKAMLLK